MLDMKLKIGTIIYNLHEVPAEVLDPKGKGFLGNICFSKSEIRILNTMAEPCKMQTVWHEIFHAIAGQRNMDIGEGTLDALAFGVCQVLMDNPRLTGGLFDIDEAWRETE